MLRSSLEKYSKKLINEGILEGKRQTAIALLKDKMPVDKIIKITGLSVKEIEKLKK